MKVRHFALLLCSTLLFTLQACYYDNEDDLYPPAATVSCDTSNVTYTGTIKSFFDNKCATSGCHQPGLQSPDLTTFATASAAVSTIYQKASDANHSSRFSWSDCEKKQLQIWCANPVQ
jgi:hypothetical protein